MSKKQNILNAHVARLVGGVLVSAGPGDVAPDWVTNTELFESAPEPGEPTKTPVVAVTPASTPKPAPSGDPVEKDDLSDLGIAELRDIAGTLEVAKAGSKAEIAARIRAHRAAAAADAADPGDADRDELIEKATAHGIPDAGDLTDDELLAAIESAGE